MSFAEVFRSGWQAIMANRLRSILTTLGIMIGVAAVIILVAFGQGASNAITSSIQGLGTNLLTVFPGSGGGGPNQADPVVMRDLTVADATALIDNPMAPDLASAAPIRQVFVNCTVGSASYGTTMSGTWPGYFEIANAPVANGTYFTNSDEVSGRRVIVIGVTVADELFGDVDPLGQQVACGGVPFTVVGVLQSKGGSGFINQDDVIIAPLSAVENHLTGYGGLSSIAVQGKSSQDLSAAESQIFSVLDDRRGTSPDTRDYDIFNQEAILETANQALSIFTALLGAVAAISLLVGGIGITNIMLVSVTERTREIGIRKAIGASRRAILAQFLVEAIVLSLFGAAAGLVLAFLVTRIEVAGISPAIVPISVVGAFVISVAIGLFFGSYPANRAASLRPIEALRHE